MDILQPYPEFVLHQIGIQDFKIKMIRASKMTVHLEKDVPGFLLMGMESDFKIPKTFG